MAQIASGVTILAGGFDLSCYFTEVTFKADVDIKDNTTLCSTGPRTFQPGLAERMVSGSGFFAQNASDDTLSIDKTFIDAFNASGNKLITIGQNGTTQGNPAILLNTKQAKLDTSVKIGELIVNTFEAKASLDGSTAAFADGVWLYQATVTGAVNGATYDNTVTNLTGWFIHVHNSDADGTVTGKVQHSIDGSTWVDVYTFTALALNTAVQNVNTATAAKRYWRTIITAVGGTTAKVSVALKIGYSG